MAKNQTTDLHKDSSRPDGLYPVCNACRKPLTTAQYASNQKETFDHLVSIKLGGSNTQDNVISCCKYCNSRKKVRPVFVMAKFIKPVITGVSQAA